MKTKTLIQAIEVNGQPHISFEIKLPSHVKRITKVTLTNTVNDTGYSSVLGVLSLQSNEKSDLVLQTEIFQDGNGFNDPIDGFLMPFGSPSNAAWLGGKIVKNLRINIDGVTGSLNGWYKPVYIASPYTVRIYLTYEIMEEAIL